MLPVIPADKANHIVYGSVIFAAAYVICFFAGLPAMRFAIGAVVFFAIGKEIYDKLHKDKHTPDPMDALATIAGGVVVAIPLLV